MKRFGTCILMAVACVALVAMPAGAALITMVNSQQQSSSGGVWNNSSSSGVYWWSDHLVARAGNDYVVGSGFALRTPTSASTFAGDSLQIDAGGNLLLRCSSPSLTINNLRLNGGRLETYQTGTATIAGSISLLAGSTSTFNPTTETNPSTLRNIMVNAPISGEGNLTKTGAGLLTLSGANTYTGTTTINQGTLRLGAAASMASRTINVASGARFDVANVATFALASGQTIKGSGQILGALTVGSGSILAPGASPGTLIQTGAQTWAGGGQYTWEVSQVTAGGGDQAALKGTAPGFDFVDITGGLGITATAADKFIIAITGLTLANVAGAVANWDPQADYAWVIATASGGITGFNAGEFTLDLAAFEASNVIPVGRKFVIAQDGNNVLLTYVPEPATLALLGLGAAATLLSRRRQRK